jgi:glycosyltransferase involved in cell wall biosynthesis
MKITIATGPIYPVPTVLGGSVQRIWHGLAREFVKRGHEVTIFAKAHEGQPAEETIEGIRFVRWGGYDLSTNIRTDLFRCCVYAVRAARRVPKGDVVVANDFWTPAVLPWLNPAAGPVVACIQRFPKRQFGLYGKCRAVVAVSEVVAEAIRQQTPRISPRVHVVPNNVDSAFLETPVAAKPAGAAGRVRILFAGRLHPEKGVELLLGALRLMGKWEGWKVEKWEKSKAGSARLSGRWPKRRGVEAKNMYRGSVAWRKDYRWFSRRQSTGPRSWRGSMTRRIFSYIRLSRSAVSLSAWRRWKQWRGAWCRWSLLCPCSASIFKMGSTDWFSTIAECGGRKHWLLRWRS